MVVTLLPDDLPVWGGGGGYWGCSRAAYPLKEHRPSSLDYEINNALRRVLVPRGKRNFFFYLSFTLFLPLLFSFLGRRVWRKEVLGLERDPVMCLWMFFFFF